MSTLRARVRLLDLIREQVADGTCILYTTHYMEEAQALCTLDELRGMMGDRDILRLTEHFEPERARGALGRLEHTEVVTADEGLLMLAVEAATRMLPTIFTALSDAGAGAQETTLTQPSLESLFIKLTGRELRE